MNNLFIKNINKNEIKENEKDILFSDLYHNNLKSLYMTALAITGNTNDAEDAIQDATLIAFSSFSKLRNHEYFKTWIIRILINRCKRLSWKRIKNINLYDDHNSISVDKLSTEEIELWDAVEKLNTEEKMLISLKYINDLTIKDISEVLKIPIGTVKTKHFRTIQKLKKIMKEE